MHHNIYSYLYFPKSLHYHFPGISIKWPAKTIISLVHEKWFFCEFGSRICDQIHWKVNAKERFEALPTLRKKCPYFPALGLNTERYSISLRIQSKWREHTDQNNSEYGHFHAVQNWYCPYKFFRNFWKWFFGSFFEEQLFWEYTSWVLLQYWREYIGVTCSSS